jgi:hypothetical protein
MAAEIDIGPLVPSNVRRVKLLIRLKSSSVYIGLSSAQNGPGEEGSFLAGATLWRQGGGPVLIRVPRHIHVVSIDADDPS